MALVGTAPGISPAPSDPSWPRHFFKGSIPRHGAEDGGLHAGLPSYRIHHHYRPPYPPSIVQRAPPVGLVLSLPRLPSPALERNGLVHHSIELTPTGPRYRAAFHRPRPPEPGSRTRCPIIALRQLSVRDEAPLNHHPGARSANLDMLVISTQRRVVPAAFPASSAPSAAPAPS